MFVGYSTFVPQLPFRIIKFPLATSQESDEDKFINLSEARQFDNDRAPGAYPLRDRCCSCIPASPQMGIKIYTQTILKAISLHPCKFSRNGKERKTEPNQSSAANVFAELANPGLLLLSTLRCDAEGGQSKHIC